ncbi:MAG: transposase, partial [Verrucomicrobiota bacterium]
MNVLIYSPLRSRSSTPAAVIRHSRQGSITKHGNPRIRRLLVELAWRVVRFQPNYPPVQKWRPQL